MGKGWAVLRKGIFLLLSLVFAATEGVEQASAARDACPKLCAISLSTIWDLNDIPHQGFVRPLGQAINMAVSSTAATPSPTIDTLELRDGKQFTMVNGTSFNQ